MTCTILSFGTLVHPPHITRCIPAKDIFDESPAKSASALRWRTSLSVSDVPKLPPMQVRVGRYIVLSHSSSNEARRWANFANEYST